MKTKVNILKRMMATAMTLLIVTSVAFADGESTEVYMVGSTDTPAGDYTVQSTNDIYHFQGKEYQVYKVYYDNPEMNMKIAVDTDGKCKSFLAYTDGYWFRYNCNKNGFGVRKVMFSNPDEHTKFSPEEYYEQSVLLKQRRIEQKQAIGMIASYLPRLQG